MRCKPSRWLWFAAAHGVLIGLLSTGGCGVEGQPQIGAQRAALTPTAVDVRLTLAPRVRPGEATTVTVQATLLDVTPGGVSLRFTGDANLWPAADLPQVGATGATYTFRKTLTAPPRAGLHRLSWSFTTAAESFSAPVQGEIEVTCSDGLFCNGEERHTRRGCVAGTPPCDDGESCTTDTCDEAARTCKYEPTGPGCAVCAAKRCNPKCNRRQCGDDGCGGRCVSGATDANGACLGGLFCVDGACQAVSAPGTCANPLPLFGVSGTNVPNAGTELTVSGDTTTGLDLVKVSCGGDGIKELVYAFTLTTKMGLDIRMLSASGDPEGLDTVLAVHGSDCTTPLPFGGFCSDDSLPPGGLGSRVYGPLDPGTYRLIATGYSAAQTGPFQLQVKFVPGCVPACDGKLCGDDGCGGSCGDCAAGQLCSAAGRCYTEPCTPNCGGGRKCGDDGCGGSCGSCSGSDICVETEGKCAPASGCDHLRPVCKSCGPKQYCGTDCKCHPVSETLIDLIPAPAATLLPSIEFEWRTFQGSSCAIAEGCAPGPGRYLLMRFTTDILNQGLAGFKPGDPTTQPEFFDYHECHQHYHFQGFANYALRTLDGTTVLSGRKLSYCMEDSYRYLSTPRVPCAARSTCEDQGIQAGWADSYPSTLDCQWLVLRGTTPSATDVPAGRWYLHETCTNTGRAFHEHSFDNNCLRIPVYVPEVPDNGKVLKYSDLDLPPMP